MTRIISIAGSVLAALALMALTASPASAQATTANKRTFLTFSGTVQVPGAMLPKGTYVFRIADPDSQHVWQVLDEHERKVLAQFFYVSTRDRTIPEANRAHGKPVVVFHETAQGVPPAIHILYYPSDLAGAVFLYPKEQAEQLAAIAHHPILANDSEVATSTLAHVTAIEPDAPAPATDADASK
jgi:hypothetical protein